MRYKEIKTILPKEISENFLEFLDELKVEGYYEVLFDSSLPRPSDGSIIRDDTRINIYLSETDIEKEIKILIFLKSEADSSFFQESRIVETREFEEAYKEFYKPFEIGSTFCIIPIWEKESTEALRLKEQGLIPLFMNPGMAFGTGHHETTRLMLSRMSEISFDKKIILDMGTGSGILSVGAGLLGASKIIAIDIDPNAVRAAEYNWNENLCSKTTEMKILEGGFEREEVHSESFDIILANITYGVISQNIKLISRIKTNHFLFSGIITERFEDSCKIFKEHLKGSLHHRASQNGWELIEWKI